MTAPVTPAAPAPVGSAPTPNKAAEADVMETVVARTLESAPLGGGGSGVPETPPPTATVLGEQPRDPATGKFVAGSKAPPPTDPAQLTSGDAPIPGEAPVAEEPQVEIPEGYVAAPSLPEDKVQGFKVRDAEGEIVPPDLTWEVNTTAGVRALSTDKLVAYAQMGVYNHEREQRAQLALQEIQQVRSQLQQTIDYARQLEARQEALMQSDDAYLTARAQYESQNTPEARIERERANTRRAEERATLVQVQAAGDRFFTGSIAPAVNTIERALPTVTSDEIGARLFLLTEHLRVQTSAGPLFPTSAYQAIQQALLNEVVPWAQQLHESRSVSQRETQAATQAATKKAQLEAEAARVRAQKARSAASAATRPLASGAQPAVDGRPTPPNVRTSKDAEAAVINGVMAVMRGS